MNEKYITWMSKSKILKELKRYILSIAIHCSTLVLRKSFKGLFRTETVPRNGLVEILFRTSLWAKSEQCRKLLENMSV